MTTASSLQPLGGGDKAWGVGGGGGIFMPPYITIQYIPHNTATIDKLGMDPLRGCPLLGGNKVLSLWETCEVVLFSEVLHTAIIMSFVLS